MAATTSLLKFVFKITYRSPCVENVGYIKTPIGKTFESNFLESLPKGETLSIEEIGEKIIAAANTSIPKTSGCYKRKSQIWWTDEVQRKVKARRKALRHLKRLPNDDPQKEIARKTFQEARSMARAAISQAKQTSWDTFCQSFNPNTPMDVLWNNFHHLNGQRKTMQRGLTIDGKYVQDPTTIAEHFADFFYSTSSANEQNLSDSLQSIPDDTSSMDNAFTLQELLRAIDAAKGHSAGCDNVGYPMIRHLPLAGKLAMLQSYNVVWSSGRFPDRWKQGLVVPIPKPGGKRQSADGYRPITLLSCIGKIYERMVNHRLMNYLEENRVLNEHQHAFRAGRGTSSYFAELREIICEAEQSGTHIEFAILDIKKAYDQTWRPNILKQIEKLNVGKRMRSCITDFLENRRFNVSYGGVTSTERIRKVEFLKALFLRYPCFC